MTNHPRRPSVPSVVDVKGVAILMVIAVLAALMAIAAPFVFSMIQHGKSARNIVSQEIAHEGAQAAVDHAICERMKKQAAWFIVPEGQNLSTLPPEITTRKDLDVDFNLTLPEGMRTKFKIEPEFQNSRGLLWSARLEDEQGKINLNSAPPQLIGNLIASCILKEAVKRGDTQLVVDDGSMFNRNGGIVFILGEIAPLHYTSASNSMIQLDEAVQYPHPEGVLVFDGRARLISNALFPGGPRYQPFRSVYEIKTAPGLTGDNSLPTEVFSRIEQHLTVENGASSPSWGHGAKLSDGALGIGGVSSVTIENGQGFSPGSLVRIVTGGEPSGFSRVRQSLLRGNDQTNMASIEFETPIPTSDKNSDSGTYIEPQMKNPVNINTASDEVLAAVFTGVRLLTSKDAVSRQTAFALVEYLRKPTMTSSTGRWVFGTNEDIRKALFKAHEAGVISAPQRDALVINAVEPNSARLGLTTVTFCCFSHGTYTVEGSGVANSDTGAQLARSTLRQLVSLPTPSPGRFRIQYQSGFQELLDNGMADRVYTWPEILGKRRTKRQGTLIDRYGRVDMGNVRLGVGSSGTFQGHQGVTSEWYDGCDDESNRAFMMEGYDMGKHESFILDPTAPLQGNNGSSRGAGYRGVATPPSSVELWYRPKGNGQCVFYDEGTLEDRNRVTFSYEPDQGLTIRIWDSTQTTSKRKPVEFIYPIQLNSGDWYHIAGSWKTSHPGGQDIRVDAQPYPKNDPKLLEFKPGGRLANDLSVDDRSEITLENGDGEDFPRAGALKIGEEVIEYSQHSGNTFSGLFRGTRMSAAIKHKAGEWVIPFGYVNPIAQDLVPGNATMVDDLDQVANTRTRIMFPPNAKPNFVLDSAVDKIPVEDATNFPPAGFVSVGGECVFYGAKKKGQTGWELNKLQRAMGSNGVQAPARNLHNGSSVSLCSIAITNSSDYLVPGIVQVDDESNKNKVEWIYYADKQNVNGRNYLVAELAYTGATNYMVQNPETQRGGRSLGIARFRHVYGIGDYLYLGKAKGVTSSHNKGDKVIPVIRMQAPHCGGWDPANAQGLADVTTATNNGQAGNANTSMLHDSPYGPDGVSDISVVELGRQDGDLRWVKQGYLHQYVNTNGQPCPNLKFTSWSFEYLVGLNDFVSRRFPAGSTRYLRWPTGDLPDALNAKRHVCADKNGEGKVTGDVDEVRVNTFNTIGGRIAMNIDGTALDAGTEQINVENYDAWAQPGGNNPGGIGNGGNGNNPLNWPMTGGLIRIEDELIYYQSIGSAGIQYYADTYPPLNTKPPERNKADRRWINPCTEAHELHPNIVNKSVSQLTKVKRGVLGTKAVEHPVGAQVMLLDAMAVTHLAGNFNGMADAFNVADSRGFPKEGYAWINDEVVSWKRGEGTSFTGCRFLRGRYGTSPGEHEMGDIVRCLPFRYWDRNVSQYDGDGLAFIQCGYRASGAKWYGMELDITGTEAAPMAPANCKPHILVRFNGKPGWETMPEENNDGALYEFKGKRAFNLAGLDGKGVTADEMEVRIYWEYLPGAFKNGTAADWKRTFCIEKLRARYTTPLIMRRLDEVEKR